MPRNRQGWSNICAEVPLLKSARVQPLIIILIMERKMWLPNSESVYDFLQSGQSMPDRDDTATYG